MAPERAEEPAVDPILELYSPAGAFEALEAFLDHEGFWAQRARVAELYLGYGLSAPLRRTSLPSPPEPCMLPLLACRLRDGPAPPAPHAQPPAIGRWERSWSDGGYGGAIDAVRAAIARGEVYQVNLVQHLSAGFDGDPAGLTELLAPLSPRAPAPFRGEGYTIVSASPELFLARRGSRLITAPIKGTAPLGTSIDGPKEAAEHMMIVDLERNDLARVCEPGSVCWPALGVERKLAGVTHLESRIEGRLRSDATLAQILRATFPGGSITGAPKIAALDLIAALEPVGRGASMGALGRLEPNGDFELALTIRTFAAAQGRLHLWVGGGVVWDSNAPAEIEESWVKARPLLAALGSPLPA